MENIQNINNHVVGNKTTNKFCKADCSMIKKSKGEDFFLFSTPKEALLNGYMPCRECNSIEDKDSPKYINDLLNITYDDPSIKIKDYDLVKMNIKPENVRSWFQKYHDLTFQDYTRILRINLQFPPSDIFENFENLNEEKIVINRITNSLGVWLVGATKKGLCLLQSMEKRMLETQLVRLKNILKQI